MMLAMAVEGEKRRNDMQGRRKKSLQGFHSKTKFLTTG
jgi:hypothetical protein